MRKQLLNLKKGISTKAERRFSEILKGAHIPFRSKVVVNGQGVGFMIGKYAIDINGNKQSEKRNFLLLNAGYVPIYFSEEETMTPDQKQLINKLKKLCIQTFRTE